MIGRVYRGHGTAGLVRYLYGPARAESPVAHTDPHLIASWLGDSPPVLAALEPVPLTDSQTASGPGDTVDGQLVAVAGGRALSAGGARALRLLAGSGSQGSLWDDNPTSPAAAAWGVDGGTEGADGGVDDAGAGVLGDQAGPAVRRPAVPGPVDARHLVRVLEAPLREQQRAARHGGPAPATEHVWHVALRNTDGDRRLSDGEWAQVARDIVHRTGLSPHGPDGRAVDGGCPWVAVRHDDTSIHLVVVLAREDGRAVRLWRDYRQLREACLAAEQQLGLTATAPADRTATTHTSRAEREKANRLARTAAAHGLVGDSAGVDAGVASDGVGGSGEPADAPDKTRSARNPGGWSGPGGSVQGRAARDELRRHVQALAAASGSEQEFFARLATGGLLVRLRESTLTSGQVTGYAVALPAPGAVSGSAAGVTAAGAPVFFGGGKLAPDLTLPELRRRWANHPAPAGPALAASQPAGTADAARAWQQASAAAQAARAAVVASLLPGATADNRSQADDAAWAAADLLAVTARLVDGPAGSGPLSATAAAYDRAARTPHQRNPGAGGAQRDRQKRPPLGRTAGAVRLAAVLLGAVGRPGNDVALMLRLVEQTIALLDAVQALRAAQQHAGHKAAETAGRHARAAAAQLDQLAAPGPRAASLGDGLPSPAIRDARAAATHGQAGSPADRVLRTSGPGRPHQLGRTRRP